MTSPFGAAWWLPVLLSLWPLGAPLQGTVHAINGSTIAGAKVAIVNPGEPEKAATTDASGQFSLNDVLLPIVVEVTARGFATARVRVTATPVDVILSPAAVTESIVITPAEHNGPYRDPATGVVGFSRIDFERIPAVTADEALRVVSGFSLFRRSSSRASNPTTHGITMRGLSASGSSRALVLFDSVPLTDGFGGWVTWTRLPGGAVEQVDVARGASGDAVGSDALGGVITFAGRTGFGPPTMEAALEGGSVGTRGVDVAVGRAFGPTAKGSQNALFAAASWFSSDGTIPVAPELKGAVDRSSDVDWANLYARWTQTRKRGRVTIGGWGGRDDRGNGTVVQRNRMSGATITGGFDFFARQTFVTFRESGGPNRFRQTFSTVATGRATETLTSEQRTRTVPGRSLFEVGHSAGDGQMVFRYVSTRSDATFEEIKPTGTTKVDLRDDSDALSVHGVWKPAAVTISGGVRHEWRRAPQADSSRDGATVGRVSAAWQGPAGFVVRGSAGTSHRWPTLNELVRNFQAGNVLTQANPDLLPEHAVSGDAGVTYTARRWNASITGFSSIVDDAIANVTLPSGSVPGFTGTVRQRRNAGEAHATGAELDGELRAPSWLRVRGSVTYVDATFRHSQEVPLEGKRLPQVPRFSGSIWTDVMLPRAIVASLVWHGVTSQFDDDRNTLLMTDANQLDLQVRGRVSRVGWQLIVENALDTRIEVGRAPPVAAPIITVAPARAVRFVVSVRR